MNHPKNGQMEVSEDGKKTRPIASCFYCRQVAKIRPSVSLAPAIGAQRDPKHGVVGTCRMHASSAFMSFEDAWEELVCNAIHDE